VRDVLASNFAQSYEVHLGQNSVMTSQQQSRSLAIINLSIKDDIIPHIFHLNSPKEVWNMLKMLYKFTRTSK
jgi:hypothetical protein